MQIDGWQYYNHAAIPTTAPHETPNLRPVEDGSIWKMGGFVLLARWTTNWDCGYETNWWYVVKDTPFDIKALNSKRRYEINKGNKNFEVKKINPMDYIDDIYSITVAAYSSWPEKYRPNVDEAFFKESVKKWITNDIFGAFNKEDGNLSGYAIVENHNDYAAFSVLRVNPDAEKLAVNAAVVHGIVSAYQERLGHNFYICDGSRSIRHESAFQDYLQKYFGFRKVYCRLNVKYKRGIGCVVRCLFPFRKIMTGRTGIGSNISGILRMEEYSRD